MEVDPFAILSVYADSVAVDADKVERVPDTCPHKSKVLLGDNMVCTECGESVVDLSVEESTSAKVRTEERRFTVGRTRVGEVEKIVLGMKYSSTISAKAQEYYDIICANIAERSKKKTAIMRNQNRMAVIASCIVLILDHEGQSPDIQKIQSQMNVSQSSFGTGYQIARMYLPWDKMRRRSYITPVGRIPDIMHSVKVSENTISEISKLYEAINPHIPDFESRHLNSISAGLIYYYCRTRKDLVLNENHFSIEVTMNTIRNIDGLIDRTVKNISFKFE